MTCEQCAHWDRPKRKRLQAYERHRCLISSALRNVSGVGGCGECDPYSMNECYLETSPKFGCVEFKQREEAR